MEINFKEEYTKFVEYIYSNMVKKDREEISYDLDDKVINVAKDMVKYKAYFELDNDTLISTESIGDFMLFSAKKDENTSVFGVSTLDGSKLKCFSTDLPIVDRQVSLEGDHVIYLTNKVKMEGDKVVGYEDENHSIAFILFKESQSGEINCIDHKFGKDYMGVEKITKVARPNKDKDVIFLEGKNNEDKSVLYRYSIIKDPEGEELVDSYTDITTLVEEKLPEWKEMYREAFLTDLEQEGGDYNFEIIGPASPDHLVFNITYKDARFNEDLYGDNENINNLEDSQREEFMNIKRDVALTNGLIRTIDENQLEIIHTFRTNYEPLVVDGIKSLYPVNDLIYIQRVFDKSIMVIKETLSDVEVQSVTGGSKIVKRPLSRLQSLSNYNNKFNDIVIKDRLNNIMGTKYFYDVDIVKNEKDEVSAFKILLYLYNDELAKLEFAEEFYLTTIPKDIYVSRKTGKVTFTYEEYNGSINYNVSLFELNRQLYRYASLRMMSSTEHLESNTVAAMEYISTLEYDYDDTEIKYLREKASVTTTSMRDNPDSPEYIIIDISHLTNVTNTTILDNSVKRLITSPFGSVVYIQRTLDPKDVLTAKIVEYNFKEEMEKNHKVPFHYEFL